jgi:uncharacterized protein YecT (DUF1311 family)
MNKLKLVILCILVAGVAEAKDTTQADLNVNANQTFKSADFMLNKAYNQLMNILDSKEMKNELKEAQKAWLEFRDLNAKFRSDEYKGGSISPMIYSQALTEMTRNRTEALTMMYLDFTTN